MRITRISSERLILIPFTIDIATSVLNGELEVLEKLGIRAEKSWPDPGTVEILPKIIKSIESVKEPTGFESWMIIRKDTMTVIGDAGFKGKPDDFRNVDIGYSIIETEQKKGFGFEAAKRLIDWAFSKKEVDFVTASCSISNIPSVRILEKLGMQETGQDEEMIYWKIAKHNQ